MSGKRSVVLRKRTSKSHLHRDWKVTESLHQGSYTTEIVRQCTYKIHSQTTLPSLADIFTWATHQLDPTPHRQTFVTKGVDVESGREEINYKILGYLFVVLGTSVFCIGFRYIVSMDVEGEETPSLDLPFSLD